MWSEGKTPGPLLTPTGTLVATGPAWARRQEKTWREKTRRSAKDRPRVAERRREPRRRRGGEDMRSSALCWLPAAFVQADGWAAASKLPVGSPPTVGVVMGGVHAPGPPCSNCSQLPGLVASMPDASLQPGSLASLPLVHHPPRLRGQRGASPPLPQPRRRGVGLSLWAGFLRFPLHCTITLCCSH